MKSKFKTSILERQKNMKKDDYGEGHHYLPEGPDDEGFFDNVGTEEWDEVSFLEDLCYSFSPEQKNSFLKELGYKIKSRKGKNNDGPFDVALKPGERKMPEESNIDELFVKEVGDSILRILLKYGQK